jgi:hypothetical protein
MEHKEYNCNKKSVKLRKTHIKKLRIHKILSIISLDKIIM